MNQVIGDYRLLAPIGEGTLGKVHGAAATRDGAPVALQLFRAELCSDPEQVLRCREALARASRLVHGGITPVLDTGLWYGQLYVAMERLPGQNLRDHIARVGAGERPVVLDLARQIAGALQFAHRAGLVHGALTASSVLLVPDTGRRSGFAARLVDFGVQYLGSPGSGGTAGPVAPDDPVAWRRLAPEQAQGPADPLSDVYAFGYLLFHLLTGLAPFRRSDGQIQVLQPLPRLRRVIPSSSPAMESLVMRLIAPAPAERMQSWDEIIDEIDRTSSARHGEIAVPFSLPPRRRRPVSTMSQLVGEQVAPETPERRRLGHVLALGTALVLAAIVVAVPLRSADAPQATARARAPLPELVSVTVHGAPADTSVHDARGAHLGRAPGRLTLPAAGPMLLRFSAPGHRPVELEIDPRIDRDVAVNLPRLPAGTSP